MSLKTAAKAAAAVELAITNMSLRDLPLVWATIGGFVRMGLSKG